MNLPQLADTIGDSINPDDLYTVKDLADQYRGKITTATIRWQLRTRLDTGLASACVWLNKRRLLISKSRYERWLATQIEAGR